MKTRTPRPAPKTHDQIKAEVSAMIGRPLPPGEPVPGCRCKDCEKAGLR